MLSLTTRALTRVPDQVKRKPPSVDSSVLPPTCSLETSKASADAHAPADIGNALGVRASVAMGAFAAGGELGVGAEGCPMQPASNQESRQIFELTARSFAEIAASAHG